ncbi:HEAT repeat domain-containing protein [bacterium]|nr:HEAT repeat domain-containing protein [bacterium]
MTVTRVALLALIVALGSRADANPFWSRGKGKNDSQVRQLVTTLRTEPDEKRRRTAVADLRDAEPRTQSDVVPALIAALQRDPAAQVRADAAEVLGGYRTVFPLAGAALETAAEVDPAPVVRDMAKQALWEYHLLGYRSSRGSDGFLGQTPEPPVAARPQPRPVAVLQPPTPAVLPARVELPPLPRVVPPTTVSAYRPPTADELPTPAPTGVRVVFTTAPPVRLNLTEEPPLAQK